MTATCKACQRAEADPHCGWVNANCPVCVARDLARAPGQDVPKSVAELIAASPEHAESARMGTITPKYRAALQLHYGSNWLHGHEIVKAAAKGKTCA